MKRWDNWLVASRFFAVLLCGIVIAGCAGLEKETKLPEPPKVDPKVALNAKTEVAYKTGFTEYAAGNFDEAAKQLMTALDLGALDQARQIEARKHLAFIYCIQKRTEKCRSEFGILLAINSNFELKKVEEGHPDWGVVFTSEKQRVQSELAAQARKDAYAKLTPSERLLFDGREKYETGDYTSAAKLFQDAIKEGLAKVGDRLVAFKLAAFSLCLLERRDACRAEFAKLLELDRQYELTPAEASHPLWGRSFRDAKALATTQAPKPKK
jgi:tetratricopeptide (TPR) repeat protein